MASIFVTGNLGFIGSAFIRNLPPDWDYIGYDRSLNPADDICDTQRLISRLSSDITMIFNFAGEIRVDRSNPEPFDYYRNNVLGFASLLRAAREYNIPVVQASTGQVKQWQDNHYLASKYMAEKVAYTENEYSGLPIYLARICNPYGPGQPSQYVIPLFIRLAKDKGHIRLNNEGKALKDYIHVDDVAKGFIAAGVELDSKRFGVGTSYLGTGRRVSVKELAKMIFSMVGSPLLYEEVQTRKLDGDSPELCYDENFPDGWRAIISLEEGIKSLL